MILPFYCSEGLLLLHMGAQYLASNKVIIMPLRVTIFPSSITSPSCKLKKVN